MNKVDSIFPVDTPMWQVPYHMKEHRKTRMQIDDFYDAAAEFIHLLVVQGIIDSEYDFIMREKLVEMKKLEIEDVD